MEDPRCCGTGTCLINADGWCWCGQRWDGERMCPPAFFMPADTADDGKPDASEADGD
jgi:hypothetical protein